MKAQPVFGTPCMGIPDARLAARRLTDRHPPNSWNRKKGDNWKVAGLVDTLCAEPKTSTGDKMDIDQTVGDIG